MPCEATSNGTKIAIISVMDILGKSGNRRVGDTTLG